MKIKGLTAIFIGTLVVTFLINFIDYKFNTFWIFTNKATKLESIIDNLCLSYIAGYIFYFLNVYLVEREEKKSILPYISFKVNLIIANNLQIAKVFKQDIHLPNAYMTREEFREVLNNQNLIDLKIFNYEKETLLSYMAIKRNGTLKNISKILKSGKYVDDELRSILFSLRESLFLKKDYAFNLKTFDHKKFVDYELVFFNYFQDIKRLHLYFNKNYKKYYVLNYPKHYQKKILRKLG